MYLPFRLSRLAARLGRLAFVGQILTLMLFATGCATTVLPSDDYSRALRYQKLGVADVMAPRLAVHKPGASLGASVVLGNKLLAAHPLPDPSKHIRQQVMLHLQDLHSVQPQAKGTVARYQLQLGTQEWGLGKDGYGANGYRFSMYTKLRLMDTQAQAALVEGDCLYSPDDQGAPLKDYFSSDSNFLSLEVERAIHYCTQQFIATLFPANGAPQPTQPIPSRSEFLSAGPSVFSLPSTVSTWQPKPIRWEPGQVRVKQQPVAEQPVIAPVVNIAQVAEVSELPPEPKTAQLPPAPRVSHLEDPDKGSSLRKITACQGTASVFSICQY